MPGQVRGPGNDLRTMHSGKPTRTLIFPGGEPGDCHATGEGTNVFGGEADRTLRAHPPVPAAAHQMSKWPARVGALRTSRDQQLGHALVRALLRSRPVDFGPVEPHRVRGAVPLCRRLRRNRRIRAGSGRCRANGRRARIGFWSHGIAVCSDLDRCCHLSVRCITPDRLQLGLGLTGLSAPPSLGILLEQRSRWRAGRRLRHAGLTATGWRVGGVDSNVNPFRRRVTALYGCRQLGRPGSGLRLAAFAYGSRCHVLCSAFLAGDSGGGSCAGSDFRLAGHVRSFLLRGRPHTLSVCQCKQAACMVHKRACRPEHKSRTAGFMSVRGPPLVAAARSFLASGRFRVPGARARRSWGRRSGGRPSSPAGLLTQCP